MFEREIIFYCNPRHYEENKVKKYEMFGFIQNNFKNNKPDDAFLTKNSNDQKKERETITRCDLLKLSNFNKNHKSMYFDFRNNNQ